MSRHRPLHTCGVSILETAYRAYKKAQDISGPIGLMTKTIAALVTTASPFVYTIQCQCLAVLSFVDGYILAVESIVETLFPPSTRLFNKIDELVIIAEALPVKFDDAVNKFPTIIHQVPFLDWALVYLISWLNFVISILIHWGSSNTREKEIVIDMNCNNLNNESDKVYCHEESPFQVQCENVKRSSSVADSFQNEAKTIDETHCPRVGEPTKLDVIKCSYKEMLEKGIIENTEKTQGFGGKATGMEMDPILELFESSWHMDTQRGGK